MWLKRRFGISDATFFAVCFCLIGYFAFHAVNGQYGLRQRDILDRKVAELSSLLAGLEAERGRLELDVSLMASEQPNTDLLDEQARSLMSLAGNGDLVILLPPQDLTVANQQSAPSVRQN